MWSLYPLFFSVLNTEKNNVKVKWQFLIFFSVKQAHQFIIVNLVNPIKFWKNRPWTFTNIPRNISAGTLVYFPGIHLLEPKIFVSLQRIPKKLKLARLTKIQHDNSIHETIFVFQWKVLKHDFFWKKGPHHLLWVLLIRNTASRAWHMTWQLLGFKHSSYFNTNCVGYLFKNKYPIGLHMIYFTLYCNSLHFPTVSHVLACSRRVQFHSLPTIWPRPSTTWTPGAGYSCAESEVNEGEQKILAAHLKFDV